MGWFQWTAWFVSTLLTVLPLKAMLAGGYQRYPWVFAFLLLSLLTSVADVASLIDAPGFTSASRPAQVYWINNTLRQASLIAIILSLIARGIEPERRGWVRLLAAGTALAAALSFWLHRGPRLNWWMTQVSRDLDFTTALLNVFLWSMLLRSHRIDREVLLISGGLGAGSAGSAMGHALRHLSRDLVGAGNLALLVSHWITLWFWWRAFCPAPVQRREDEDSETMPLASSTTRN